MSPFTIGGWTITKPQSVTVYNSSGSEAAQTTYEYDNYSHSNQPMQASNEQLLDALDGMLSDSSEHVAQIGLEVQAVQPLCSNQTIQDGCAPSPGVRAGK